MSRISAILFVLLGTLIGAGFASAQQLAPGIGYMTPSGGTAGRTVEVTLGGYDWTPDIQLFVLDPRIELELLAPPGEVIVPELPYWFGKKARRAPFLLPREARARLTIPDDIPEGLVKWQVANANGASATGRFLVSRHPILTEEQVRGTILDAGDFPLAVAGQIKHIREVDCFEFTSPRDELITCAIRARVLDSPLNAVLEIRDESGRLVSDAADTGGNDVALTFLASAGKRYQACLYDVDFRGNRSFVYQLEFHSGPRVVGTIPAVAVPGTRQTLQLLGYGLRGQPGTELETITREFDIPQPAAGSKSVTLESPDLGRFTLSVGSGELPEVAESRTERTLTLPVAVTGVLEERYGEDVFHISGRAGDSWKIDLHAEQIGSPLDVTLVIADADHKELARSDDLPGTTDAGLEWTVPADGEYRIVVSDVSGHSGQPHSRYRLAIREAVPGFELSAPELLGVLIGGKATLAIKATRTGGFSSPIAISVADLPEGVSVPDAAVIPEKQSELKLELTVSEQAPASARLVTFRGTAENQDQPTMLVAETSPVLIATTLTPPFSIDAEGKDDVTKWPRGATFPAPVLIERDEGFDGEIVLEMTSRQGRHRQGIRGPELVVPPDAARVLYPVFLPEWLETTRTSRMVVNGVARVPDPQGTPRYVLSKQKTRMGFLPVGALLKVSTSSPEREVRAGQSITLPFEIGRSPQLREPVRLELSDPRQLLADSVTLPPIEEGEGRMELEIDDRAAPGEYPLTLRAAVLRDGRYPIVAEASFLILVVSDRE
jgi:hypothetical protein